MHTAQWSGALFVKVPLQLHWPQIWQKASNICKFNLGLTSNVAKCIKHMQIQLGLDLKYGKSNLRKGHQICQFGHQIVVCTWFVFHDLSILFILSPGIQTMSICSGQDGKYSNLFAEDQTSIFSPPFLLNPFKTHNQASDHSIGNQYNFYITAFYSWWRWWFWGGFGLFEAIVF